MKLQTYLIQLTTDFNNEPDIANVADAVIENTVDGKIEFGGQGLDFTNADLDSYVFIQDKLIGIDTNNLPNLNVPATITFYNIDYVNPRILRDDVDCASCSIVSYVGGNLVVNVPGFSNYTVSSFSALEIWDETDTGMPYGNQIKYPNDNIMFFANYSDSNTGLPISGGDAACDINYGSGNVGMSYNSGNGLYESTNSYGLSGTYNFDVNCSATGYDSLALSDDVIVSSAGSQGTYDNCTDAIDKGLDMGGKTCVDVVDCGTLSNANTYYLLNNDVVSDGTCFDLLASGITLDLNGHTLTFGNAIPMNVPNMGFESGTGTNADNWDQTSAPSTERTNIFPQAIGSWAPDELENWVMKFPAGTSGEYVYSDPIAVTPGEYYILSAMVYDSYDFSDGVVVEIADGEGCTVFGARYADNWAANLCSFQATTNSVRIRLGLSSSFTQDMYIDSVMLKPGPETGVYGPTRYPNTGGHYGVVTNLWSSSGVNSNRVTNGNIVQGQENSILPLALKLLGSNVEADYLNITVYGSDSTGIWGVGDNSKIHHNNITLNSKRTHWSHETVTAAILLGTAQYVQIYKNNIIRTPSSGIGMDYDNPAPYAEIYNNTFNVESSAIHCYATHLPINGLVYNNFINNTHGNGMGSSNTRGTKIYNNYVETRDGPQEERGWISKAIWVRYDSGGLTIYNNTFIGYSGVDVPRSNVNSSVATVRIGGYSDVYGPNYIYDNYIKAHTNLRSKDTWALALDLSSDQESGGVTQYISNNTIESNDLILSIGGSQWYAYASGHKNYLVSNIFKWSPDVFSGARTIYCGSGYVLDGNTNSHNQILNTTVQGGADVHDIGYTSSGERDLNISWYLNIRVEDGGGSLVSGANIIINDTSGITRDSGTSVAGEVFRSELVEQHIGGWGSTPTITDYSPYTITVTYNGETQSRIFTLDKSKTETFVFSGAPSSGIGPTFTSYTGCSDPALDTGGKSCTELNNPGSCPGTLSIADEYYLLMTDLAHTGGGYCVTLDAQNITFDMNNHEILYQQTPTRSVINMASNADYSDYKNGKIEETTEVLFNDGGGDPAVTIWCDYCRVHDMNITTRSFKSKAIYVRDIQFDIEVDHNHISRLTTEIYNTMDIYGIIHSVLGMDDGRAVQVKWGHAEIEIYNNLFRPTKRNRNPYAIRLHDFVNDAAVYNNTIISDTAQGILVSNGNVHIYDNFMNVTSESLAAQGIQEAMGNAFRIRERFHDSIFENNTVIFRIHPTNPFEGTACYFTSHNASNNTFRNNTCIAITHDNNYRASAFAMDESVDLTGAVVDDNHFITNSAGIFLGITWGGDVVFNGGGNNLVMKSNTVEKLDGTPLIDFYSLIIGNPGGEGLVNNTLIDTRFINNNGFSERRYTTGSSTKEFIIKWYLNVLVRNNGVPVSGANVEFFNNTGQLVTSSLTDINGITSETLEEFREISISRVPTAYYQSPYNVTVTYGGETQSRLVTLNESKTETFVFSGVAPPCHDINNDGIINIIDLAIVIFNQGHSSIDADWQDYEHLDLDNDATVDYDDVQLVLGDFGSSC